MKTSFSGVEIEVTQGDIAQQPDMDAVVNAANAELRSGGGVAGAIHRAAGPELEEICRPLAPIAPGEAVITEAFHLPNQWVIHCLGPVYGRDKPEEKLLADCYRNALQIAENHQIGAIAFPAISAGIFGYPLPKVAEVVCKTLREEASKLTVVDHIRMVLYTAAEQQVVEKSLAEFLKS